MEGHLDPAAFHGFVSGTLTPEERDSAVTHLDGCSRCRRLLSALMAEPGEGDETLDGSAARTILGTPARGAATIEARQHDPGVTSPDLSPLMPTEQNKGAVTRAVPLEIRNLPIASDQLKGQKLGDYLVQDLIAKGGMGAVYRGVQPLIGKQVAIKVLLTPGPVELNYAQRMLEEARTVNSIGHPNIIDIFNFGELPDGRPWLVMEYIDGVSLSQWVRSRGPESHTAKVLSILEQIAAALEAVHVVGVVHRDLKPANVMITQLTTPQPRVKVLDFGFAKNPETSLHTSPDLVLGTPGYMSPEQIQSLPASPQSDLYSMGLLGYFMLTGTDAYQAANPVKVMHQQLKREPASLMNHPVTPPELARLIADLTRIDPALRPKSAKEVRDRLRAIISSSPAPRRPSSPGEVSTLKDAVPPAPVIHIDADRATVRESRRTRRPQVAAPADEVPPRRSYWPWVALALIAVALGLASPWLIRLARQG